MKLKNKSINVILLIIFCFWFIVFKINLVNFWFRLTIVTIISAIIAVNRSELVVRIKLSDVYWGIISAIILYFVFYLGKIISVSLFPNSINSIAEVYKYRQELNLVIISLLLLLIVGPAEELFWRGLIQQKMIDKMGVRKGYLFTSLLYASIHLWTGNFILILAALVAGLFWGYLRLKTTGLGTVIISHGVWDFLVFVLFPFV